MIQQLTINFDATLAEAYDTCRELLQARVHQIGRQQKAIAADLDMAPSQLTRKLAQAPGDSARFTLDDLERYFQTNTDRQPLHAMLEAYLRLKELGWRDAIYCPKDGTLFDAIEAGSSGIHTCRYRGDWPKGRWEILADGDIWPAHPILFRPKPE